MGREARRADLVYHRQLVESRGAEYTWLQERGLSNHTITRWKLGVVLDPLPNHRHYRGRITIPYYDAHGNFRAIRGRDPQWSKGDRRGKYELMWGAQHLFGVRYAYEPIVYVVEGEFDTMIMHQLGLKTVGVPGANAWDHRWRWVFRHCEEVIVVPDPDGEARQTKKDGTPIYSGGLQFKYTVLRSLRELPGVRTRVVTPPQGLDPTDWYLEDRRGMRRALTR